MGKYNLITEPWIPFLKKDGTYESVGFAKCMIHMDEFACISCNSRMTDESLMGVLAALAHTILYRYDENGNETHIKTAQDAMNRIDGMVRSGGIPENAAKAYFEKWKDRFFLFDEKYPFFQSPLASMEHPEVTSFSVAKLKRRVLQSGVKKRWRVPEDPYEPLSYANAAKDMIACIMYDDCALKPKGHDKTSGVGYLGTFALLSPETGSFLTNILARICLLNEDGAPYSEPVPVWEKNPYLQPIQYDPRRPEEDTEPCDNIPSFYTYASRRMYLNDSDDENVKTFSERHGERRRASSEVGMSDPRIIWRGGQDGRVFAYGGTDRHGQPIGVIECMNSILGKTDPWTASATRKEFAQKMDSFSEKSVRQPGLITWMERVKKYLPDMMNLQIMSAQYGSMFGCLTGFHISSTLFPKTFLEEDSEDRSAVVAFCADVSKLADIAYQFGRTLDTSVGRDARKSPSGIRDDLTKRTCRNAESSLREAIVLAKRTSGTTLKEELSERILNLRVSVEEECLRVANQYVYSGWDSGRGSTRVPVPQLIRSTQIELHKVVPNTEDQEESGAEEK